MSVNQAGGKFFHVLHSKQDDKWHIKEGNGGTIVSYVSKEEAVEEATRLAQEIKNQPRHVIVHKTNGAFEKVKNFEETSNTH